MHGSRYVDCVEYVSSQATMCLAKRADGVATRRCKQCVAEACQWLTGGKTCFKHVTSLTFEQAMSKDKSILPETFSEGFFCEDFEFRCGASARTWQRSHAQDNLL